MRNAFLSYPELAPGHPLEDWLASALDGQRLISAAELSGGYRNDNVSLVTDDGRRYVLRRYRHDGGACAVEATLLARHGPDGWTVTAVLDWEFAFSAPLFDVGNLLRFADGYPPGFADGFLTGFVDAGGHLPPDWREVSRALDLYALAEFTTRPTSDVSRRAVALLRHRLTDRPAPD